MLQGYASKPSIISFRGWGVLGAMSLKEFELGLRWGLAIPFFNTLT